MKVVSFSLALFVIGGDGFVSPFVPPPVGQLARSRSSLSCLLSSPPDGTRSKAPAAMSAKADVRAAVASCGLAAVLLFGSPLVEPSNVAAVSGGGLDYAGLNLTGQDFSKGKYKAKDFSGVIAKEVSFKGSDLRGTRFFKADLKKADFTGANLGTASLEEADLDGTILTNAVATGSYFGSNMNNVGDISGADFTDALIRKDVVKALCQRPDAKGTNPVTEFIELAGIRERTSQGIARVEIKKAAPVVNALAS